MFTYEVNGDGLRDILYWFKVVRKNSGEADCVPHFVDNDSGFGTLFTGADLNWDKMPDIIVSNKKAALCSCRNSRSRNLWKAIDGENCGRIRSGIS